MFQLVNRIPDDNVIGFLLGGLGIICGTAVILTAIVARNWNRSQQRQVAAPLIRDMLNRGMSSEEIQGVFAVAFDDRPGRRRRKELHALAEREQKLV